MTLLLFSFGTGNFWSCLVPLGIPLVMVTFPANVSTECGEVRESECLRRRSEECAGDELVLAGW